MRVQTSSDGNQGDRFGITLVELLVVVAIIGLLVGILLPAVQRSREAARRAMCLNRLKQIGLALSSYQTSVGAYPFGVGGAGPVDYIARWSAHSQMLPYLEMNALFNSINFSFVPWNQNALYSAPNRTALSIKIAIFLCPSDFDQIDERYDLAHNNYRGAAGTLPYNLIFGSPGKLGRNNGMFWYQSAIQPSSILDGSSTTACFSERCLGVSAHPDPLADFYIVDPPISNCLGAGPTKTPRWVGEEEWSGERWGDGGMFYTRYQHIDNPNKPSCNFAGDDYTGLVLVNASSRHPGGVDVLFADGSARFIKDSISNTIWRGMGTIAGGETIDEDSF